MKNTADELIQAKALFNPASRTADVDGTGVENNGKGFGEGLFTLEIGAVSGTTPTLDVKLQESDDNVTYTDIAGAAFGQKTDSDADSRFVARVDLQQRKKFIRAVATIAGTTPDFLFYVGYHRLGNEELPISQEVASEFSV